MSGDPFDFAPEPEPQPDCTCGAKMERVIPYWFIYSCQKCKRLASHHAFVIQTGIRRKEIAEWEAAKAETQSEVVGRRAASAGGSQDV